MSSKRASRWQPFTLAELRELEYELTHVYYGEKYEPNTTFEPEITRLVAEIRAELKERGDE